MKKILVVLISMMSIFAYAEDETQNILCTCNVDIGLPSIPGSEETVDISVEFESDGGIYEATRAEVDIVVAYKCLQEKSDVRKIYKMNSIECNIE